MLKTKKIRRLLAGLLAVLMLSVCLPVGAFAADVQCKVHISYYDVTAEAAIDSVGTDGTEVINYPFTEGAAPKVLGSFDAEISKVEEMGYVYEGMINTYSGQSVSESAVLIPGDLYITLNFKPVPETAKVTVKLFDSKSATGFELGDFEVELTAGEYYTVEEMAAAYKDGVGYVLPTDYELNDPDKEYEAVDGMAYDVAMTLKATEPVEPETATVKVAMFRNTDGFELGDFTANLVPGKSYTLAEMAEAAGYALPVDYEENIPTTYEAIDNMVYNISMALKATEPVEPETVAVKVQMYRNTDGFELGDFTANLVPGKSYTLAEMAEAAGYALPVDYEENIPTTYEAIDNVVYNVSMKQIKPDTATVKVQMYLNTNGFELGDFTAELVPGQSYTLAEMAEAAGYVLPVDYEENIPGTTYEAVDGVVYDISMKLKVETATVKVQMYRNTDGFLLGDFTVELVPGQSYTLAEMAAEYGENGYALPVDYVENFPGTTYEAIDSMVYDISMREKDVEEPVTPSEPEDVNFRVEYVDESGASLLPATNIATTYDDFAPSVKLLDVVADEIAQVEAEGYTRVAATIVYEDGYETTPLTEPFYIVPDYNGKVIKIYFDKVFENHDVNVRFEYVDMDGNTIHAATNYATVLNDGMIGSKVSDIVADEVNEIVATGYNFDHYAWVYADGTETVLTDPVVVPDYDGTTIKVYFVKVEEYEDVHVRFEFVDMDGNSVLPATNYATCLSDSVVGPKVNDVLADELSTMEGRNYNFHHYAWVYSDGTETELDNDVIVVPDHDGTTIKVYFEAVKTEPSDPSTGDNTTTVTGKDEHPDIAEAKANGTWGAPTATPAAASTIPQTGDSMPVVMLIVIALVAAGAVGGLVVLRKRSHQ